MPLFKYKAVNKDKYTVNGQIEAFNKKDAIHKIKEQNLLPFDLQEVRVSFLQKDINIQIGNPIKLQDKIFFLSQFSNLLKAGLGIVDALKIIIDQTTNKHLEKILIDVLSEIRNGNTLYVAFSKYPKEFPKLILEMIKVGELTNTLDKILDQLRVYYEKQYVTSREIKSAMSYPMFLLVASTLVSVILLTFVVPQFQKTFQSAGLELPAITKFVLSTSYFLQNYILHILVGIVLISLSVYIFSKKTYGQKFFSKAYLKIPVLGDVNKKGNLVKISRTLGSLITNHAEVIESLNITKNILTNTVYADIVDKSITYVENGVPLNAAFSDHWAVEPVFSSMLAIGEETASLGTMLNKLADYYDTELEVKVQRLKTMLEPVMVIFLAVIVGTIVLAIMVPMFKMLESGYGF